MSSSYSTPFSLFIVRILYLQTDTFLYRFFMAKIISIIKAFSLAFLLSCALLIQVIFWSYQVLILLFIDTILLFLCYSFFKKLLQKQIQVLMLTAFAKHWTIILNVFVLMVALTLLQLYSTIPEYLDNSLEKTLIQATQNLHAQCQIIDFFVILNAQKEAVFWWLMVNASENISNNLFKWLAWLSFLLSGSLGVWGYSRYLVEIISWIDTQEEKHG